MATTTFVLPEREPKTVIAGTRVQWLVTTPDFLPANGWTLKYALAKADTAPIVLTSSDNSDGRHLVDVAITATDAWMAGEYAWQSWVEDAGPTERRPIAEGLIEVCPRFDAEEQGLDWRSHVKATLDALEATIQGKASKDHLSYSIAGRSVGRMNPSELVEWRNQYTVYWRQEKQAMRKASGKRSGNRVLARFGG